MVGTRSAYRREEVEAAKKVLTELVTVLEAYRDEIVLVGGWVPALLIPNGAAQHVGTTDIDLAIANRVVTSGGFAAITRVLAEHGYVPHPDRKFTWVRTVSVGGRAIEVLVDFLTPSTAPAPFGGDYELRELSVDGATAVEAPGVDLALAMATEKTVDEGPGDPGAPVRVACIVPFLVMKAAALGGRIEPKDAADIVFCLTRYPGGIEAVAAEFEAHLGDPTVRQALEELARQFATPDDRGPKLVSNFEEISDAERRTMVRRDAFERVDALLRRLGFMAV